MSLLSHHVYNIWRQTTKWMKKKVSVLTQHDVFLIWNLSLNTPDNIEIMEDDNANLRTVFCLKAQFRPHTFILS